MFCIVKYLPIKWAFRRNPTNMHFAVNHNIWEPRGVISIYLSIYLYIYIYIHRKCYVGAKCILTKLYGVCFQEEPIVWLFSSGPCHPRTIWAPSQYKDGQSRYGNSHCKDKAVVRPFHLYNGNPYTGKTASLFWDGSQESCWHSIIVLQEKVRNFFCNVPRNHTNVVYVMIYEWSFAVFTNDSLRFKHWLPSYSSRGIT